MYRLPVRRTLFTLTTPVQKIPGPKVDTGPAADVTAASAIDFVRDPGPFDGSVFFRNWSARALLDSILTTRPARHLPHDAGPNFKSKNRFFSCTLRSGEIQNINWKAGRLSYQIPLPFLI
jgi:hypothetical protein